VVAFLHGGSPFKVWQPDSFRIRLNRRSTFNYGRDILHERIERGYEIISSQERPQCRCSRKIGFLERLFGLRIYSQPITVKPKLRRRSPDAPGAYGIVEFNPHLRVAGLPSRPNRQLFSSFFVA
jgi:hypothetical protein